MDVSGSVTSVELVSSASADSSIDIPCSAFFFEKQSVDVCIATVSESV